MKSQFPIKEGRLEIFEDRIEIGDKWKSAKFQYYYLPIISLLYPLALVGYRKLRDDMWWIWLVLLIIGTLVLLFRFFNPKRRIFESQLQIDQIDKVILEKYSYDKLSAKFI